MRWLLFVLLVPAVSGALISGSIYGPDLAIIEQSILTVNTSPEQVIVILDGSYALELGEGSYIISVESGPLTDDGIITISDDGVYVRDFILFPNFDLPDLSQEPAFGFEDPDSSPAYPGLLVAIGAILALTAVLILLTQSRKRANRTKRSYDQFERAIIEALIKRGGRASQKEIRSELPFSEAKASLVIADLASRGIVHKFKHGRGNIIVLKDGETKREEDAHEARES